MNEAIETKRIGNYRINVYYDYDCENPRTDWDNASHMVIRNRYVACESDDVEGVLATLCDKYNINNEDMGFREAIDALSKYIVIKPISVYTHSGSTVYYGEPCCRWDSGVYGFGYMELQDLYSDVCGRNEKDYPDWRKQCEAVMNGEMETFDRAVRGEVYGFVTEQLIDGEWEHFDSCWGYFESIEDVIKDAESCIPSEEIATSVA